MIWLRRTMRPCYQYEGSVWAKEGEGVSTVKRRREEKCKFILEQLRKEYIRPSNLSQIAPVFFVGKKDRKKHIVQDYRYLNEWTVKNNYSLPLISDIVENTSIKKVFMKMDLR